MKIWQIAQEHSTDISEQLLINRNIPKKDWASFLEPQYDDLFDPMTMTNMAEAVQRLKKAYLDKEIIGIFGDYDADGIPGSAMLHEYLKKVGFQVSVYIPSRAEGYGLNKPGVETLKKEGVKLLITIDLGTRNAQEIEYAKNLGLDCIVIDHHEFGETSPDCLVLNPKEKNNPYPFSELAGTGVVFKFMQAVNEELKLLPQSYLKWYLDLVAIATICDVVPLVSENRIFAKFGLMVLRKTKRIGLLQLYHKSELQSDKIDTYSVGFQIGPRINAPGRMDHANASFYLLTSHDKDESSRLAQKLNTINRERQDELERVLNEARQKVCKKGLDKKKVILVEGKNWPQGIVGLVAGRLMEEYARPVIVCEQKEKTLRGSARSIDNYDMVSALEESKLYLTRFGGHKKAAGLTLELDQLSHLYDKLLEIADSKLKAEDLIAKIKVDKVLKPTDLNLKLLDKLKKFEPFGLGNPRPVFAILNANLSRLQTVGNRHQHLKLFVEKLKAIAFDGGSLSDELELSIREQKQIDIVFTIDEDTWDGTRKIQLKIIDFKINK